jgi:4-aminobutyrate aminotransferase
MVVGRRIIEVIKRDRLLENATKTGQILKNGLNEFLGKKSVTDVRGLGLMAGVEFETRLHRDKMLTKLFQNGLLILGAGQKSLRIIPPLIITKAQVENGLSIIDKILTKG